MGFYRLKPLEQPLNCHGRTVILFGLLYEVLRPTVITRTAFV